jgi:hypothetical protein
VSLDAQYAKLAALEAERERLVAPPPKPGQRRRDIKEDKALTAALRAAEARVRAREEQLEALRRGEAPARPFAVVWVPRLARLAAVTLLLAAFVEGSALLRARSNMLWVETTCAEASMSGDDDAWVAPRGRPTWAVRGAPGACWVPESATVPPMVRFAKPVEARVSRVAQVAGSTRELFVFLLALGGAFGGAAYVLSKSPLPALLDPTKPKKKKKSRPA